MPPKGSQTRTRANAKTKTHKSKATVDSDDDRSIESIDYKHSRKRALSSDDELVISNKKKRKAHTASSEDDNESQDGKPEKRGNAKGKPVVLMKTSAKHLVDDEAVESDGDENNKEEETEEEMISKAKGKSVARPKKTQKRRVADDSDSDCEIIETPTKSKKPSSSKNEKPSSRVPFKRTNKVPSRSASPIEWEESTEDLPKFKKNTNKEDDTVNKTPATSRTARSKKSTTYLEDLSPPPMSSRAAKEPDTCEVTNKILWDPLLKDTYKGLPPLKDGGFVSTGTSSEDGSGVFLLSQVPELIRDANMKLLIEVITFTSKGRYYNPSRTAPHHVKSAAVNEKSATRYAVIGNATYSNQYAIFTSVIAVSKSDLDLPSAANFRSISGLLCSQEWERLCAFFCTVFKETTLGAPINDDALSFTTRQKQTAEFSAGSSDLSVIRKSNTGSSPVKASQVRYNTTTSLKGALGYYDTIPVYDGTKTDGTKTVLDMDRLDILDKKLPLFHGNLSGSICLVGYTANTWASQKSPFPQLSCNIQFVVVLAY